MRGINRHSYLKSIGSAMTEEQHANDMEIMKELGVNTIRLCHYPQTDYFYDLCDENGIIVWTEIPVVNEVRASEEFKTITKQQLTELISQQYNRPSVCFWGLQNEIGNGQSLTNPTPNKDLAAAKKIMSELDTLAKQLDTTGRYTTQAVNRDYAMNQNKPASVDQDFETNIGWKSDIVAWNIYPGWYPDDNFYGSFDDVMKRKTALDSRSMGISEYGWGANVTQHEAYPELGVNNLTAGGSWHPEEYQNLMNEEALSYINTHDELWGTFYWVMFDFAVDSRNEGSQPALNDKGLVTADRTTKKDSFYLYKANWNQKEPFVYITSRRWVNRENSDTYIKVYSNCEEVTLSVNDQELGKMESKGNGVFLMENVSLTYGDVNIKVVGKNADSTETYTDTCTWKRESSNKADLTSKIFTVDTTAKTIAVENNITLKDFKKNVKGVNNAVYQIYDGNTEVTQETAIIVPGMRIHVIAENKQTEADYTVISTNLCLNKPVTVSSFEPGNAGENAVDGNSATRWTAANGTFPQTITIDLEKTYFLGDLTLDWEKKSGSRYYGYTVSVSEDGENYINVIDRKNNTDVGSITDSLQLLQARYLKITATGCNESGWATLYEIKADGYLMTSDQYTIDGQHRLIIVDNIPNTGLADSTFSSHLMVEGNYDYKMNYSSGWIHDGNTVDIIDTKGKVVATYTICTEETKENYYKDVPVTKITLNKTSDTLDIGSKLQLTAAVFPVNASNTKLSYTSNNSEVASVTETGLITANKAGTATITATSTNGVSAACSITVIDYSKITPAMSLTFDNASEVKLYGNAALATDPDNKENQVLLVDDTAGGKHASYAIATNDLSKYDFSNGVTVSMKIRPTANSLDWNYLFAIGQTKSHNSLKYCDGTIGFIARHGEPYEAHFPNDGWIEGNPVNSDYAFFTKEENANQWHRLTYVYGKSEICLYVDGILTCRWPESKISDVLAALNQGHLIIGAGSSESELENFGGYLDDIYVYDSALNAQGVAAIGKQPGHPNNIDRTPLLDKISEAKEIKQGNHTEESYQALQTAIAAAEKALDTVTSEEEVTAAVNALQAAIDNLKEKNNGSEQVLVTKLTLTPSQKTLNIGQKFTLKVDVSPQNASNPTVTISSSNSNVAQVSGTQIIAKSSGKAIIKVIAQDGSGVNASLTVKVRQKTVTQIKAVQQSTNRYVKVTFGKAKSADSYDIYRSTNAKKSYKKIGNTKKNSFIDKRTKTSKTYYYKIVTKSKIAGCNSTLSGKYAKVKVLARPTIKAKASKGRKIKVSWKQVKGAKGYVVYSSTKKTKGFKAVKTLKKAKTVKTVIKAKKSVKKLYLKVRPFYTEKGSKKYGAYSKPVLVKVKK